MTAAGTELTADVVAAFEKPDGSLQRHIRMAFPTARQAEGG